MFHVQMPTTIVFAQLSFTALGMFVVKQAKLAEVSELECAGDS